jgi:hypothetical protein
MEDETLLIVGFQEGFINKYNLDNPLSPQLMESIKLHDDIYNFLKLSERYLLCGQNKGFIDVLDIQSLKSVCHLAIENSRYINDMTRTAE